MRFPQLIFIFLLSTQFYAQDSRRTMELHQKFKKHIFKNTDSALYFLEKLKSEKDSSKAYLPTYYYHQNSGQYYFVTHSLDSSEYHYNRALEISQAAGDSIRAIDSDIWLATHRHFNRKNEGAAAHWIGIYQKSKAISYVEGIANSFMGLAGLTPDLAKKLDYGYKVDSLYSINDTISTNLVNAYTMMADIYHKSFEDDNLVRRYAEKSVEISEIIQYPHGINGANHLLAESAMRQKNYKEARLFYHKSLNIGLELRDQVMIDGALLNLGKTYLLTKEPDKTIEFLKRCSQTKSNPSENSLVGWVHLLWAETYLTKKNYNKVTEHLTKAKKYSDIGGDLRHFKIDLYNIEHRYFSGKGNYKAAYEAKENYDRVYKSLEKDRNKIAFILSEQKKTQQEISLLKSQNELAEQQKENQRNLLLGGIGVSAMAALFLFILYRNRRRTNKKLRQIDALKTNFFTNISHEFRTPLTLISSPIQESLEEPGLSEEKRKHFELAQKNTKRLSSLVDQLLELSKIESGNRSLFLEKNYPTQMIAAWSESFFYLAKQKNIDFKTNITDKKIEAWFDHNALENIIINLLGNAVKYTPKNGTIQLFTGIDNKRLNIRVKNSGEGLTKVQMKNLFNRFYQTDEQNEGAGIGLSLIKELTELHGGDVKVTSQKKICTIFEVTLSLDKRKFKNATIRETPDSSTDIMPVATFKKPQTAEKNNSKELPIALLVEDNLDLGILLTDTFNKEYKAVLAVNGQEGITKALELIPDIIVSDVMMPIKDGIELAKTLKADEKTSHIPIVLLTAKAGDKNELIGIETGADDYITKPFNKRILKAKVASLIATRQKLRSRYSQEVILKPKDIAVTSVDTVFLERVQKVLHEKLTESSFSANEFCTAVNMSRMQLHRKLKALTGLSTTEFMRTERLKLAAILLKQSDINISEVGYQVGFNDPAYFSKCFKEVYQCTPTAFSSKE